MNEVTIIMLIFFIFGLYLKRKWLIQYIKQYKDDFKLAWNGKAKVPSQLELITWDKKKLFMVFVVLGHIVLWFFVKWWITLISFILIYFVLGSILLTYVWVDEDEN